MDRARVFDAARRVAATARMVTGPKSTPLPLAEAQAILEEAAAEGFVLLRNEGDLLPHRSRRGEAHRGDRTRTPPRPAIRAALSPRSPSPPIRRRRSRRSAPAYGARTEIVFEPGVDPQPRLPAMPMPMTVDYFASPDCSGEPHFSEQRATNSLVWFQGQHTQGQFDVPGSIRASGTFQAEQAGGHRFYLGATGSARILIDGKELLARAARLRPRMSWACSSAATPMWRSWSWRRARNRSDGRISLHRRALPGPVVWHPLARQPRGDARARGRSGRAMQTRCS